MLGILKNPTDAWKWVGEHEVDLGSLPVRVRQAPSRFNAVIGSLFCLLLIIVPLGGGYMSVVADGESVAMVAAFMGPLFLLGLAMVPFIVLSLRSGRTVVFDGSGVAARGKWFRRTEDWSAPYSGFEAVEWRIEDVWTGRTTRTFYVIELRHREREKTIPLFVHAPMFGGMDDRELAGKAKVYADALGVPLRAV
ncbi:MAG: hypothetical protein QNJ92_12135 [Alphaproteobacteria bacterium]|nr:hypothetical protein [Alphaproteobacteria bacterium]